MSAYDWKEHAAEQNTRLAAKMLEQQGQINALLAKLAAIRGEQAASEESLDVYGEIRAERGRQDAEWGEQNHPDADPVILARLHAGGDFSAPEEVARRLATEHCIPTAVRARRECQLSAERDETNWTAIAVEELAEALEATTKDDAALRAELVQLAAVAVAWIEAIDRRQT